MLADIACTCRLRALQMVYEAGRGHLGTSFSSMDIIVAIRSVMGPNDIFLSSKGHDAPAQYAVLEHWGILPTGGRLRVAGGLPGHPTIDVPGIACNTGSLGMGLSKACGFVHAKRLKKKLGRVYVLLGDGEMSEGQNYEAMLWAARNNAREIVAIVDSNGYSQDGVAALSAERIRRLFQACAWSAAIVADATADELAPLIASESRAPRALIVRTIKGKGVSFMEDEPERWHQQAPTEMGYEIARRELR